MVTPSTANPRMALRGRSAAGPRRAPAPAHASAGMTLIELMIGISIMALLIAVSAPFAASWVQGARAQTASSRLQQGFAVAKATALRNPDGVALPAAAASLTVSTDGSERVVQVCRGAATAAACTGGTAVVWTARFSGDVGVTLAGQTLGSGVKSAALNLDNRGTVRSTAGALAQASYRLSIGTADNEHAGTLQ